MHVRRLPVLLVLLTTAGLATGCGSSSGATGPGAAGANSSPAGSASLSSSSSPAPAGSASVPANVDQVVRLTYADGQVSGDTGRVKVKLGSRVAVVVTSDVADEVHLHGYNKMVDVPAGGTATLTFTANIPGIFEIELESRSHKLTELQVG
jgi:hypothetical protein